MNKDLDNQVARTNRFIFSDDFYNQLSNEDFNSVDNSTDQIETPKPLPFDSNIPKEEQVVEQDFSNENMELENRDNQSNDIEIDSNSVNEINIPNISNNIIVNNEETINNNQIFESDDNSTDQIETPKSLPFDSNIPKIEETESYNDTINTIPIITSNVAVTDNDQKNNNLDDNRVTESNYFNNDIHNQIIIDNKPGYNIEENIEQEPKKIEVPNIQLPSKLNVETGINTDLEQEILNYRPKSEVKPSIVQNTNNTWGEDSDKKVAYRAIRNPIQRFSSFENANKPPIISNLKDDTDPWNTMEEKIETPSINVSQVIEESWHPQTPPPIIIKDGELEKIKSEVAENNIKNVPVIKSDLLEQLRIKEQQTGKISILARYGEDFCSKDYITNPAIGRQEEIKQLILILLTPEKSAILVGKPGIGKTSIVEGLAYCLQRNNVPNALRGYRIVSVKATSLLGSLPTGETRLQTLIDELKELDKIILFMDEIHMLMGATDESSLDFANMFKESLGRGSVKMIGATTNDEYERYVLRDKAFIRRFQRVDVEEPTKEQTVKILIGTLPKIEKNTGAKLKYSSYIQSEIMNFIVDITTEYKRVYGIGSRYPDICLTLLSQAFSQAVFDNRKEVNIFDIRNAIENSKNIYPDVIRKELINFDEKFKQIINEEKAM